MDTRFSVAVHSLILIAKSDIPLTSEQIAASAGVNPSYVRKILTSLRNAGIISAHRGIRGFRMNSDADTLSLLQIYQEVCEQNLTLFDIHQNPMTSVLSEGISSRFLEICSKPWSRRWQ